MPDFAITGFVITNSEESARTKFINSFLHPLASAEDRREAKLVHESEADARQALSDLRISPAFEPHDRAWAGGCSVWRIEYGCHQLPES